MSVDLGPFQDLVGISFPQSNPEDFIDGEDLRARDGEGQCQSESEYPLGTSIDRSPIMGTELAACVCGPLGAFAGSVDRFTIQITIPIAKDWPGCVVGATSGALILPKDWPDEPGGWGAPFPDAFSYPAAPRCTHGELVQGFPFGGSMYIVQFIYQIKCYSIFEQCAGCEIFEP